MSAPALRACGQCRHLNSPDAKFCNQCGHALQRGGTAAAYTPRHLGEKILKMRSALEGERKQVTVLFVDVKGSVALSQQVEAEQWHQIMDRFFGLLSQCIHDYEGTINQYTGDGVMALFGAPLAHEDHARRACRAALAIRRRVQELAAGLAQTHQIDFAARLGLNSGEVIVGKIGDDLRMDYTAQGETVGLAARMEQLAKPNSVLVSEATHHLVEGYFSFVDRGETSFKGYKRKLRCYELREAVSGAERQAARFSREQVPLVGREREFSLLQAYRERVAREKSGLLVALTSGTGMGKSRLCFEFAQACREAKVPVFETRGASHHRAEPLLPFVGFFRSFFQLASDDDPAHARDKLDTALAPLEPLPPETRETLLAVLGLETDGGSLPANEARRTELLQHLLLGLLRSPAMPSHAVCIVENFHWLDDPSAAAFFDQMFDLVPAYGLMVLITSRSDFPLRWTGRSHFRHLPLRPLDADQTRSMLNHLLGDDSALDELKHEIGESAGGSPMFVEEVVRQLVTQGVLERDGKQLKLKRKPGRIELPPSVEAVVAARIDALAPGSKRLLQLAAVIGRRVPLALLRRIAESDAIDAALAELREQEFLVRDVGPEHRAALVFTQSLFQQVAYRMLLREQRQEMHQRVAQALESEVGNDAALAMALARHYRDAGERLQAVRWFVQAADAAAGRELTEALPPLNQARELLATGTAGAAERSVHLQVIARWLHLAARCHRDQGDLDAACDQGEVLLEQGVEPGAQAFFGLACGTRQLLAGDATEALEHYRAAVRVADEHELKAMQVVCRVGLVYGLQALGQLQQALEQADQGIAIAAQDVALGAEHIGHSPLIALQALKAWISVWLGRLPEARQLAQLALDSARERHDQEQIIAAQVVLAYVAAETGQTEQSLLLAGQALELARRLRNAAAEVISLMALGRAQLRSLQWAQAIPSLEDALGRVRELALGVGEQARIEVDLAMAQLAGGNARAARDLAASASKAATASRARLVEAEALLAQATAGLYSRRPLGFLKRYDLTLDDARAAIDDSGARLLEPQWHYLRARWHGLREEHDAERAALALAQDLAAEMGMEFAPPEPG